MKKARVSSAWGEPRQDGDDSDGANSGWGAARKAAASGEPLPRMQGWAALTGGRSSLRRNNQFAVPP